jgi:ketosteroid isomerase-like protein
LGFKAMLDATLRAADTERAMSQENVEIAKRLNARQAVVAHWSEHSEVLDEVHREVEEWIDAGDRVISVGRGKASGAEVEGYGANAGRFRDGKLVEWIGGFPTRQATLDAVVLRE